MASVLTPSPVNPACLPSKAAVELSGTLGDQILACINHFDIPLPLSSPQLTEMFRDRDLSQPLLPWSGEFVVSALSMTQMCKKGLKTYSAWQRGAKKVKRHTCYAGQIPYSRVWVVQSLSRCGSEGVSESSAGASSWGLEDVPSRWK